MHRRAVLASLGTAMAGLAGCTGTLAADYDVGMSPNAFAPERVEVRVGDVVVWENTSSRGHTVTAYEGGIPEDAAFFASGSFQSEREAREEWADGGRDGVFGPGARYEHTFEVPGTYQYFCVPHERGGMVGSVVVRE